MDKHNDGYALPFVLVVMVIICLVGVSILSASLNNLQNQQASIERMQAQYEVVGEIEKKMAQVEINKCVSENILGDLLVKNEEKPGLVFTSGTGSQKDTLVFTLDTVQLEKYKDEPTHVECTIEIKGSILKEPFIKDGVTIDLYKFTDADVNYLSYEILNVER